MIYRPDAIISSEGELISGMEVEIDLTGIVDIRPCESRIREENGLWLSPAFVNAHSHLEYYDLMGTMPLGDYFPWINALTKKILTRTIETAQEAANRAALQNYKVGVSIIGEHSNWPVSPSAMKRARLSGRVYYEIITLRESASAHDQIEKARGSASSHGSLGKISGHISAHTAHTANRSALNAVAAGGDFNSIHVMESAAERELFESRSGDIYDALCTHLDDDFPYGSSPMNYLDDVGLLHEKTQLVHCCDFTDEEIELAWSRGATIAHCPRSNIALNCPMAPIAKMLEAGISIGLGMDSAASSGEIDMFAEMRAAIECSNHRAEPITASQVWNMATIGGVRSLAIDRRWEISVGANPDLMLLRHDGALTIAEFIANATPQNVVSVTALNEISDSP